MTSLYDRVATKKMIDQGNDIPSPEFNRTPEEINHAHPTSMVIVNKERMSFHKNTESSSKKIKSVLSSKYVSSAKELHNWTSAKILSVNLNLA